MSVANEIYREAFDRAFDSVGIYEIPWFEECHAAGLEAVVERAAAEAQRGYLVSESCDDIAARIRDLVATPRPSDPSAEDAS